MFQVAGWKNLDPRTLLPRERSPQFLVRNLFRFRFRFRDSCSGLLTSGYGFRVSGAPGRSVAYAA